MATRELYIDRLRVAMTALVLLHHTAITYGANGGWFWYEQKPSGALSSTLLTFFCATDQAYFMGFFFLLAGYFTPHSLEKKGYLRFLVDRFLRLGVPLLAFILTLGPLTGAMAQWADGKGFWATFPAIWQRRIVIVGPLWFAEALLIFALAYCGWRAVCGSPLTDSQRIARPVPKGGWWLLSALGVGAAALAIRQIVPTGVNIISLQLGYFASYIFLFALGIAAWRYDWLRQLSWSKARAWLIVAGITWFALPLIIALASHAKTSGGIFSGALSPQAILYAFWEPLVAWGIIAALIVLFRERMNAHSALWEWLGRRAFAVYILHPPVVVGIAILLHGWAAPALVKFGVTGTLSCILCWLLADPLVRLPGVRRVV
jgi:peptidoglycan/LPS O-acetylase OafA/YrhL